MTVGCYADADAGERRLPVSYGVVRSSTECYMKARSGGQTLFALQFGGECWAGTDFGRATSEGTSSNCNRVVHSGENGGGGAANLVHSIGMVPAPARCASQSMHATTLTVRPPRACVPPPTPVQRTCTILPCHVPHHDHDHGTMVMFMVMAVVDNLTLLIIAKQVLHVVVCPNRCRESSMAAWCRFAVCVHGLFCGRFAPRPAQQLGPGEEHLSLLHARACGWLHAVRHSERPRVLGRLGPCAR